MPTTPSSFNPVTSAVASRSTFDTIYTNVNGTHTELSSIAPMNVLNANGSWAAINTAVTPTADGGFSVANNPLSPKFAATSGGSTDYSVTSNGNTVSSDLVGAATVAAGVPTAADLGSAGGPAGSAVAYPNVLPGDDLVYQVTNSGVDESLMLSAAPSQANPSWVWDVHAPGLTLSTVDGDVDYTDANGVLQLVTPIPVMSDSSGVAGESQPVITNVPFTLSQLADGDWAFTLTPDPNWLDSADRVYPVYVDPGTMSPGATGQRAFESNGTEVDGVTYVGNSQAGGLDTYWRTTETYNYSGAFGDEVTGGGLELVYSTGTTTAQPGSVYVPTSWSYSNIGTHLAGYTVSAGTSGSGEAVSTQLTDQIRSYVNSGVTGYDLGIHGNEVAGSYTYKGLSATLRIDWESKPTVALATETLPDGIVTSPNMGASVGPADPVFQVAGTDPSGGGLNYTYYVSTTTNPATDPSPAWKSLPTASDIVNMPSSVHLTAGTWYYWEVQAKDEYGYTVSSPVYSWTPTSSPTAVSSTADAPADQSIVATTTPTFTAPAATDTNSEPLTYYIRVTSGADGESGEVVQSPLLTPSDGTNSDSVVSWSPPVGTLQDGASYTWEEVVNDVYDDWIPSVNRITVNLRVSDPGPAPIDSAGPVTVNLANGNVSASFSSPTVSTVGGAMGFGFNYNSEAASRAGLTGTFYSYTTNPSGTSPSTSFTASGVQQVAQRTDPDVGFDWGSTPPSPSVPLDGYLAQWTGFLTPPKLGSSTTYQLGFAGTGGAALYAGPLSTLAINDWSAGITTGNDWGPSSSNLTVAAGGASGTLGTAAVTFPIAVTIDYFVTAPSAGVAALGDVNFITQVSATPATEQNVPASWFTKSTSPLPSGWSSSGPIAGDSGDIIRADVHEGYITFTDVSGGTHTYVKSASGAGYTPPAGENGVVAFDSSGNLTFTDDAGTNYQFNSSGQVTSVSTPEDASNPAEPIAIYSGQSLTALADPLSKSGTTYAREITFQYVSAVGGNAACPAPPTGYVAAPVGMICQMNYPNSTSTQLLYDANGQLAELIDPGSAVTNFGYTQNTAGNWLLSTIRNSLANDFAANQGISSPTAAMNTTIAYTTAGIPISVTLPAPDGVTTANQPCKSYTFPSIVGGSGTTKVTQLGLTTSTCTGTPTSYTRTVTFNSQLQTLTDASPSGLTTSDVWDNHDDLLESTSPSGATSITQYDTQFRPTATYGPAPSSCFAENAGHTNFSLSGTCPITPAESDTTYDGGMAGLNVAYYGNQNLAGAPALYALGVGTGDGTVNGVWASSPVTSTVVPWSALLTGSITFPTAGTYVMALAADYSASLYVNDQLVSSVDTTGTATAENFVATAGETVRVQINFAHPASDANLSLSWTPPGGTSVLVPGADLSPDYSLVTATHSADSVPTGMSSSQVTDSNVATAYANPWFGQAASTTVDPTSIDPTGLNLTSSATYETPSTTTYARQLTSTKPAGSATTSTNTYYTATGTIAALPGVTTAVCGLPTTTPEYGMLAYSTGPVPAAGTTGQAITQYVYDVMGRVVGEKSTGDSGWTCITYDSRGRVTQTTIPDASYSGGSRIITDAYTSASGNPLTTSVQDNGVPGVSGVVTASPTSGTITTVSDLLGNTVSYTDVWDTVTTNVYNILSQLTTQTSTPSAQPAKIEQFAYNVDGQVTQVDKSGLISAQVTYNPVGQMAQVAFPVGTGDNGDGATGTYTYDPNTGAETGLSWAFPSSQPTVSDATILSQEGQVLQDTITDGTTAYQSTYSYDAAGRLTQAVIPNHTLSYSFAATGGCGADAAAGADGNRTSYSDVMASATTSTTYCYDNADRLTSDAVTNPVTGASPLAGTNLVSTGTGPNLVYDAHGNITTLEDQTMTYDESDRHMSTAVSGTTVVYERDADDRIVSAETTTSGTTTVAYYSYNDDGSAADWTFTAIGSGTVLDHTYALPGGVTMDVQLANTTTAWSFPNLHGDDIVVTDAAGNRQGSLAQYDPFGDPIDPTTHLIGSTTADDAVPNDTKLTGTQSFGWEGSAGKLYQHTSDIATIEMGARQYVPLLGRFLSVDPVAGANANDYNYPNDPINGQDLTGTKPGGHHGAYYKEIWTDKVGRISSATGRTEEDVEDAIHEAKQDLKIRHRGGPKENPDIEVNLGNGEIRVKGGRGGDEGNLDDYLGGQNFRHSPRPPVNPHVDWNAFGEGTAVVVAVVWGFLTLPVSAASS